MVRVSNVQRGALSPVSFISLVSAQAGEWYVPLRTPEVRDSISPACCFQLLFFFSYHGDKVCLHNDSSTLIVDNIAR